MGVGATWLWNDTAGNHMSEAAMEYSGGGFSYYEPPPAYQQRAGLDFTSRMSPDVAFVGGDDSGQGLAIYDSYTN